jgi:anti-anti-sigma factor
VAGIAPAIRDGAPAMPINQWSSDISIAELSDEPLFSEDMHALFQQLEQAGDDALPHVIINLQNVSYLNSSNIAQLLRLRKKLLPHDRRLRLCSLSDSVWSALLITGLDNVFDFTEDVSTALASLQMGM